MTIAAAFTIARSRSAGCGLCGQGRSPDPLQGAMMWLLAAKPTMFARLAHIAAAVAILWLASTSGSASATPEIGEAAPALVVNALDGTTFDLAKLRGKVVLVNYWATWCAPCRKEMPKLDAFYKRYHAQGLEIIGISIDFERDFENGPQSCPSGHLSDRGGKSHCRRRVRDSKRSAGHLGHRCRWQSARHVHRCAG